MSRGPAQSRWWTEDDPAGKLFTSVGRLDNQSSWRRTSLLSAYRLYGDAPITGFEPGSYSEVEDENYEPLSYNVIRSITDTVHAEIVQSRPRPMFLTSGGKWGMRRRAEKLTKFADGIFYGCEGDATTSACARDAILFGDAAVKVFEDDGEVCIERVLPGELYVDQHDAAGGKPRSMYQVKYVDRCVLKALYPEHADEIENSSCDAEWMRAWSTGHDTESDLVVVVEAWHLKSGKKAKDGRHVIAVSNIALVDEEWTDPGFPFAFLRWSSPIIGFWTTGAAEQLRGIQYEINALLESIREAQDLMGQPCILAEKGSILEQGHLTNDIGKLLEYVGAKPEVWAPQHVSRDTYEQLDRYYAKAFELFGVSALSATSQKPAGLDSGRALRTYADFQSKRFLAFGRAWEAFHMAIAKLTIACARRIADEDPSYSVVYRDSSSTERIEWADVDLDEEEYVLKVYPVSALGSTPAGRLATLQDWLSAGVIDQKTFARLSDSPDLESAMGLADAPHELIEKLLEKMVDEAVYISPEPFFDLVDCKDTGIKAYNKALIDDVPEDRLAILRTWIQASTELLEQQAANDAPPPPPPGAMPPDMPPPPPMGGPPMPEGIAA